MKETKSNDYIRKIQCQRIKELMHKCNITGKKLAEELNYSPQHISYVINGKRNLTREFSIDLADFFSKHLNITKNERIVHVDYRYILGESDYIDFMDNFDPPVEETPDYLFKKGITAILHHYGYDLDLAFCPDITSFEDIKSDSPMHSDIQKLFLDSFAKSKITNKETGFSIDMLPADVFQLFQDFKKAIIGIVDRKFEKDQWYKSLNTAPSYINKYDGPLWPVPGESE